MEQQNTGQKVLDSLERAKLGLKVFNLPFDEAEEVIDEYVSQGNYDPASVELLSLGSIACVSGSPNLALNSKT